MKSLLSLWLLPPEPILHQLQLQINDISQRSNGSCPSFLPHVTVLGAFPCSSDEEAHLLLHKLQSKFQDFGPIPCSFVSSHHVCHTFTEKRQQPSEDNDNHSNNNDNDGTVVPLFGKCPLVSSLDKDGKVIWNQSCLAVMKRSPSFLNAIRLSKQVLFGDGSNYKKEDDVITFPPPIREPHFSFAYGHVDVMSNEDKCMETDRTMKLPPDFSSTEMALFWTYPATLEGVSQWSEVGRVPLTNNDNNNNKSNNNDNDN